MIKSRDRNLITAGFMVALSVVGVGIAKADTKKSSNTKKTAAAQKIAWRKDWEAAKKAAKSANKLLMVDMYTDWCGWCKKLDSDVFPSAQVVQAARSVVPVKLNAEQEGAGLAVAKRYKVTGFPTTLFIDGSGAIVDRIGGYMPAGPYAAKVKEIVQSHKEFPALQAKVRSNPNDAVAGGKLVLALVRRERMPEAVKALGALDTPENRATLGPVYNALAENYLMSDEAKALMWYNKTIDNSKKNDEVLEARLGVFNISVNRGDKAEMRKQLDSIVKTPGVPQDLKSRAQEILKELDSENAA